MNTYITNIVLTEQVNTHFKTMKNKSQSDIHDLYINIKNDIEKRLQEFNYTGKNSNEKEIFLEFIFCILTPQSNAKLCWEAATNLYKSNILWKGSQSEIAEKINKARFKNNKSKYIIEAREKIFEKKSISLLNILKTNNIIELRDLIVKEFKGIGFKEGSHFLRNIGKGKDIAILDRHILKNMVKEKVIKEIPKSINRTTYLNLETKLINYSKKIKIPADHLDFVFWYKEKNEIFK